MVRFSDSGDDGLTFGRIEFPSSKRKQDAKWALIPADSGQGATDQAAREEKAKRVLDTLFRVWKLPLPSVLITVVGDSTKDKELELNDKQKVVLRRGLIEVCRTACAGGDDDETITQTVPWVITLGVGEGVARLIGQICKEMADDGIPCIGVAPWGVVSQRELMANDDSRQEAATSAQSPARKKYGVRYEYDVTRPETLKEGEHHLDPNHSHFLFVHSNGPVGVAEAGFRMDLIRAICNKTLGQDEDGDDLPLPPSVSLVLGGGHTTYNVVHTTLRENRPVVLLPDSGGAARDIHGFVTAGDMPKAKTQAEQFAIDTTLPQIKKLGEKEVGANLDPQLTSFSTQMDSIASNDLSNCILTAILSDCEKTVDAINLAVRWRDPGIIRAQLAESHDVDPSGMSKAFQSALLGRDAMVVETLIEFNARVDLVDLKRLMDTVPDLQKPQSTFEAEKPYNWSGVEHRYRWVRKGGGAGGESGGKSGGGRGGGGCCGRVVQVANSGGKDGFENADAGQNALIDALPEFLGKWYRHYKGLDLPAGPPGRGSSGGYKSGVGGSSWRKAWTGQEVEQLTKGGAVKRRGSSSEVVPPANGRVSPRNSSCAEAEPSSRTYAAGVTHYPLEGDTKTSWLDLMLWAVMADNVEIARHTWAKTAEPMRAAIWAAHVAHAISKRQLNSTDAQKWEDASAEYEAWARAVLDEETDVNEAVKLLTYTGKVYQDSTLDNAIEEDPLARPCKTFVNHPFCQAVSISYFLGDRPGSRACIESKSSVIGTAARLWFHLLFLNFLPIVDVRVRADEAADEATDGPMHSAGAAPSTPSSLPPGVVRGGGGLHGGAGDHEEEEEDDYRDVEGFEDDVDDAAGGGRLLTGAVTRRRIDVDSSRHASNPKPPRPAGLLELLHVPIAKFVTHTTLTIAYIVFWAINLCGWPWMGAEWMHTHGHLYPGVIHLWEVIIWTWTALRLLEEMQQFILEDTADYISDLYNLCDILNYFTALGAMVLRIVLVVDCGNDDLSQIIQLPGSDRLVDACFASGEAGLLGLGRGGQRISFPLVVQLLYGTSLLLLCSRSIGVLKIDQQIGVLVISLGNMFAPILYWGILTLCITVGFSLFFTVSMPAGTAFTSVQNSWPGWQPFWGLLGEFGVDHLSEWKPPNDPFDIIGAFVPFFLWAYCFVSTVVLVNLLIAQMSSAYTAVEEKAPIVWTYDFTSELVREFKDTRKVEPAPFNVFRLLCRIPRVVRHCSLRQLVPPPTARDRKSMGFKWDGGTTVRDRRMRAAEHQRRQKVLRTKVLAKAKDQSESSIEAQVALLLAQQHELEAKQEQRLETVLSSLARIEGTRGGARGGSPEPGAAAGAGGGAGATGSGSRGDASLSVTVGSPQRSPSPQPVVMRGAPTPGPATQEVGPSRPLPSAKLSQPWSDMPKAVNRMNQAPIRDLDLRTQRNAQLPQLPRKPSPRPGPGQPMPTIRFAL